LVSTCVMRQIRKKAMNAKPIMIRGPPELPDRWDASAMPAPCRLDVPIVLALLVNGVDGEIADHLFVFQDGDE
jgi:hypothetical protein